MLQYLYFYVLFIYSDLSYIKKEALQMLLHNKTWYLWCGLESELINYAQNINITFIISIIY